MADSKTPANDGQSLSDTTLARGTQQRTTMPFAFNLYTVTHSIDAAVAECARISDAGRTRVDLWQLYTGCTYRRGLAPLQLKKLDAVRIIGRVRDRFSLVIHCRHKAQRAHDVVLRLRADMDATVAMVYSGIRTPAPSQLD